MTIQQRLQGKRLGIIEEALCGYAGHWYEWIRSVKLINEAAGVRVRVAGYRGMDPEAAQAMGVERVLERNIWGENQHGVSAPARYLKVATHNFQLYQNCARLLQVWGELDCVMAPVVRIHHLIAWLALTRRYGGKRFHRLVMQVNIPEGRHEPGCPHPTFKRSSELIRRVIRAYKPYVDRGLVCFGSDSDQTGKDYEYLTGVPFVEFPTPRVSPPVAQRSTRVPGSPVVFCCLGPSRQEKGSDLFLEAMQAYLELPDKPAARFVLQWTDDFDDLSGRRISPSQQLMDHPDVKILRGPLTSTEYDRELMASDCLLLPYRWRSYFCRISGVAVEAATAGIPMVCTADTWLERTMSRYAAGVSFPDGDVPRLVEALVTMARGIDDFQAAAVSRIPVAREVNSPENFLKCLWGITNN